MPQNSPEQQASPGTSSAPDSGAGVPRVPPAKSDASLHNRSDISSERRDACPAIPDHELLKKIGDGSYGEVWLARSAVGTLRAVKIVWRKTFGHEHPFEREFKGIQKFEPISRSHEGMVDILQIGRSDGYFYYVMELADDAERNSNHVAADVRKLASKSEIRNPESEIDQRLVTSAATYQPRTLTTDVVRHRRLPMSECLQIGLSLTSALGHLHKNGLVHRDVKPSNIIFVGGVPKLADIGLVTEASEARSYVGTEGFIPPEGPGSPQADLYSLGKLLYEISTGKDRHAFPELPPDLTEQTEAQQLVELNSILLKACQNDARERYQSAEEMRAELELLQRGQSVNRQRARRRNLGRVKTAALAISALGLVLAILYSLPIWKSDLPAEELSKNAEATDAYQQGVIWFHKNSIGAMAQAAKHFERAIELDTNFAAAYAYLAHAYAWMDPSSRKMLERIRSLANKALALDDKLLDARIALGWTKALIDHDWSGADKEYRHAIKLNPSSEFYLQMYATYLVIAGRTNEAVQQVEKALRLPSHSVTYLQNEGFVFLAAHQYDRAIKKIEEWIELEPSQQSDLAGLTTAYREKGDYMKAIQKEEEAALLQGGERDLVKTKYDALRSAYNLGGARGYWQQLLDCSRNNENDPVGLAALYARVGDKDGAFRYLNLAFEKIPTDLAFQINKEPSFDSLRTDREFVEVLKKLGLGK